LKICHLATLLREKIIVGPDIRARPFFTAIESQLGMHSFEFVIEALTTNGFLRITPRGEL
jgi:hypothetical protein